MKDGQLWMVSQDTVKSVVLKTSITFIMLYNSV